MAGSPVLRVAVADAVIVKGRDSEGGIALYVPPGAVDEVLDALVKE